MDYNLLDEKVKSFFEIATYCKQLSLEILPVNAGKMEKYRTATYVYNRLENEFLSFLSHDVHVLDMYNRAVRVDFKLTEESEEDFFTFDYSYIRDGEVYFIYIDTNGKSSKLKENQKESFKKRLHFPPGMFLPKDKINIIILTQAPVRNYKIGNVVFIKVSQLSYYFRKKVFNSLSLSKLEYIFEEFSTKALLTFLFYRQETFDFNSSLRSSDLYKKMRDELVQEAETTCSDCKKKYPSSKTFKLHKITARNFHKLIKKDYSVVCRPCQDKARKLGYNFQELLNIEFKKVSLEHDGFRNRKYTEFRNRTYLFQELFLRLELDQEYSWETIYSEFYQKFID